MIITTEVLDKPKITFSPPTKQLESSALKRPLTAITFTDSRKKAKATTELVTFPRMMKQGGQMHPEEVKKQVATATIFLSDGNNKLGGKENVRRISRLECEPFVITASFESPNLNVDTKTKQRKEVSRKMSCKENTPGAKEHKDDAKSKDKNIKVVVSGYGQEFKNTRNLLKPINLDNSRNQNNNGSEILNLKRKNSDKDNSNNRLLKLVGYNSFRRRSSTPKEAESPTVANTSDDVHKRFENTAKNNVKSAQEIISIAQPKKESNASKHEPRRRLSFRFKKSDNLKKPDNSRNNKNVDTNGTKMVSPEVTKSGTNKGQILNNSEVISKLRRELNKAVDAKYNIRQKDGGITDPSSISSIACISKNNDLQQSRNNSLTSTSIIQSRNNSLCGENNSKRPSISLLQENRSFIDQIRSRNNSLTQGLLRTRSNSLTNVANVKSRNNSVSRTAAASPFLSRNKLRSASSSKGRRSRSSVSKDEKGKSSKR